MVVGQIDLEKEYGLVLEGGGAKGAYQIGVWKALLEYGVKIKAISGVSVGALNGALICMGDYDKAVELWKNISYSRIMNVDDTQMEKLVKLRLKEMSMQEVGLQGKRFLVSGGIDVTPLKQLIEETVEEQKVKESEIEFILGTFSVSQMKEIEIAARDVEDGCLKDYLLASANFPVFKNEKLFGKTFLDGGIVNNVPIDMLVNRGYKDIIVIRIFGPGIEKRIKIPEDVNITYIAPRTHLCNVLEFDQKKAVRSINLGYLDTLRILKPLIGKDYYIEAEGSEKEYFQQLLNIKDETVRELLLMNKQELTSGESICRRLTETVLPQLAAMLKLEKSWTYQDLYYSLLEYAAKKLRLKRNKVYTRQELTSQIISKGEEEQEEEKDILLSVVYSFLRHQQEEKDARGENGGQNLVMDE